MTVEKLIEQILSVHVEMSKLDVLERLEKERKRTGGLISDGVLLRVIAAKLGVKVQQNEVATPSPSVIDLVPNLNSVTVVGRAVAVFSPKTFQGRRSGVFASLLIADQSGLLRVVLWDDKARLAEAGELRVGQVVRFSRAYTREGRSGQVELHVGDRCKVEVNPDGVDVNEYPTIEKFVVSIGEVTRKLTNKRTSVAGVVRDVTGVSVFERQDASQGKVLRFLLADETGAIPVVVWNEKADELESVLKEGIEARIVDGKVKKALSDGVEVHVDAGTYIELHTLAKSVVRIGDLKEGAARVSVEGEVASKPTVREVRTSKGETVKLAVFELKDKTGKIWVSAWREQADFVKSLNAGARIVIEDAYVRKGFGEQLEISMRNTTSIYPLKNQN